PVESGRARSGFVGGRAAESKGGLGKISKLPGRTRREGSRGIMSQQAPNNPQVPSRGRLSALTDWCEHRTGIKGLLHSALYERVPGGSRWRYVWGSTLTFALM